MNFIDNPKRILTGIAVVFAFVLAWFVFMMPDKREVEIITNIPTEITIFSSNGNTVYADSIVGATTLSLAKDSIYTVEATTAGESYIGVLDTSPDSTQTTIDITKAKPITDVLRLATIDAHNVQAGKGKLFFENPSQQELFFDSAARVRVLPINRDGWFPPKFNPSPNSLLYVKTATPTAKVRTPKPIVTSWSLLSNKKRVVCKLPTFSTPQYIGSRLFYFLNNKLLGCGSSDKIVDRK